MKTVILSIGMIFTLFTGICSARAPHEIAGFVLDRNIGTYENLIRKGSELPIRHREYLREVEIEALEGFKSGLIEFGNCTDPGRIVKIKLKYADSSRKFYDSLLKKFKQRFGKPDTWGGDPFQIVINWKWSFKDDAGNKISLHLQHNTKDAEEKKGNAVKLTLTSAIEQERRCYEKKHPAADKSDGKRKTDKESTSDDWERFVPR